jgi:hypothetical protein
MIHFSYRLYKTLRHHAKLSERRSPMYERSKASKYIMYGMGAFGGIYLAFFGVLLFMAYWKGGENYDFIGCVIPFLLVLDFLSRFAATQTPAQKIKGYILQPIIRKSVTDAFLVNSLMSSYNLLWFCLFIPYAYLSIFFASGALAFLGFIIGCWLIILINSQWYMLCRSLINKNLAWIALPVLGYALFFSPLIIWFISKIDTIGDRYFDILEDVYCNYLAKFNVWEYLSLFAILGILIAVNRSLQASMILREITRTNIVKIKKVSKLSFLDRFGQIGEYMKLETKSVMRCKVVKTQFFSAAGAVLMFSLFILFDFYNDMPGMKMFGILYNFSVFTVVFNSTIMGKEGNYIDCLMTNRENILSLLKAKYIFTCMFLIIPFILIIPSVIKGNVSLLAVLSFTMLSAGPINLILFIMAIYTKDTLPLWDKVQRGSTNNKMQLVTSLTIFLAPLLLLEIMNAMFSETVSLVILLALGILFTALSPIWLRMIYERLMVRKYMNLDGFHNSHE